MTRSTRLVIGISAAVALGGIGTAVGAMWGRYWPTITFEPDRSGRCAAPVNKEPVITYEGDSGDWTLENRCPYELEVELKNYTTDACGSTEPDCPIRIVNRRSTTRTPRNHANRSSRCPPRPLRLTARWILRSSASRR